MVEEVHLMVEPTVMNTLLDRYSQEIFKKMLITLNITRKISLLPLIQIFKGFISCVTS